MNFSFSKKPALLAVMLLSFLLPGTAGAAPGRADDAQATQQSGGLYSAALYIDGKQAASNIATDGTAPRQLRVIVLRSVKAAEVAQLIAQGMSATASNEELLALVPALFGIGELLGEQTTFAPGDGFQLDWSPATGTTFSIRSNSQGAAASQSFKQICLFDVMSRSWLRQPVTSVAGS